MIVTTKKEVTFCVEMTEAQAKDLLTYAARICHGDEWKITADESAALNDFRQGLLSANVTPHKGANNAD